MAVHWKIQFLRGGGGEFSKKPIYKGELPKKGELGQLEDLQTVCWGGKGLIA